MTPTTFAPARLLRRRPLGPRGQLIELGAEPGATASYTAAGQYCEIRIDGRTGYFAIARPPGPGALPFYVQDNGGSSTALLRAPLGTIVELGAPAGQGYPLTPLLGDDGPVYALATGSGYFGARAALWTLAEAGRTATVYAGFRAPPEVLGSVDHQRLRDAGFAVHLCYSRPPDDWTGRRGYVQANLAAEVGDLSAAWVLACGQAAMLDEARALCADRGLPPERFLTNY